MKELFSTKEVAKFLDINEKMVYSLISEKGLPATKITGKWLFPRHLVEQWIEANTINYPEPSVSLPPYQGLLILTGSNDPLLDRTISLFNSLRSDHIAVFGNIGSLGGISALRQNLCHIASSHLLEENEKEYNFDFATRELERMPAVVNFCRREQGLLVKKKNPKNIRGIADLAKPGVRIVNRPLSTGTRLLFDRELSKAEINGENIEGYHHEIHKHLDVGIEILSDRADAGPGIRAVASLLGTDFIPLRWERYDLLILKERFFDQGVQLFIGLLHDQVFADAAKQFEGYDISLSGKMVFPYE
ncbi:helix-turn-helix transcriptional regulator [Desulfonema magnum]|uniref:DNA-binding and PBP domains-containing protein n=1 Tax=Desulfonema magnum TaxID=45655 RepID=A0A975BVE9_9BACT|nr:helix-turn-helix transcriptional regulator [Desulfonema magnum]QTA92348.1 DNA-binding and PBP domains-containing protein [Desulfonema magnum]